MNGTLKRHAVSTRHGAPQSVGSDKAKNFGGGRRGVKRLCEANTLIKRKSVKKKRGQVDEKIESEEFCEEPSNYVFSEEEQTEKVVHREPTMYDNLLKKLGSANESVANALRMRQREEDGESDTDEGGESDTDEGGEEDDTDEGGDADLNSKGADAVSPTSRTVKNCITVSKTPGDKILHEDGNSDGDDDDEAMLNTDEDINDQCLPEASMNISTFDNHLNYKISSVEVDDLLKRKWSFTWQLPVLDMKNCNWLGTREFSFKDLDENSYYGLKPKLYNRWLEICKTSGGGEINRSKQKMFFSLCNSYCDIMHHNKRPFYLKGLEEDSNITDAYLMHSLNHIFRSRDLMSKNERKLAKNLENMEENSFSTDSYLDRGFTRPKILILLPLAGIARRVISRLVKLSPSNDKDNVENVERFYEEFGSGIDKNNDNEDDLENNKSRKSAKPPDFQSLLGRDNDNDHFMIGIKFTKRGIKLYGDFYTSDVIVASPLGLITKIGVAEVEKDKDVDYLSSIEILIIDHADVMLMQNWSHVKTVVEQLNKIPSKQHGTDIMRIRPWYLDGQACFYRQTIILSSHINPEINSLFNQHCLNHQGKVKLQCNFKGVLSKIFTQVRQFYESFDSESLAEAEDARFKYFCEKVYPKIKDSVQNGFMIFASSYFEFVRLRNFLKAQATSFCLFGEYIKPNDISRIRGQFFRGEKKIMLYTERAHFYYRYKIRGVQNLIIYSLPERKEFYPEIVNLLEQSSDMNCTILFSRLDYFRLERVVGSAAAKRMTNSNKGIFVFT